MMSVGEIISKAAADTLLGMGIVFSTLLLISFIIYLFKFTNHENRLKAEASAENSANSAGTAGSGHESFSEPKSQNRREKDSSAGSTERGSAGSTERGKAGGSDIRREQDELIAVIAAAAEACRRPAERGEGGDINGGGYIVRSVRRRR